VPAKRLWGPGISNWFPGVTPAVWEDMSVQQMIDAIHFIERSQKGS